MRLEAASKVCFARPRVAEDKAEQGHNLGGRVCGLPRLSPSYTSLEPGCRRHDLGREFGRKLGHLCSPRPNNQLE